jgi:hypothetical protein
MDPFMSDITSRAAGSAIAKVGTSIIEKLASKAAAAIKDQLAQVDLWSEYERRYIDRYGKVKLTLSGMREPLPLEQIYTGVRFLDGLSIGQFSSIEASEKEFREKRYGKIKVTLIVSEEEVDTELSHRFQQQNCRTQDGMAVANDHPLLMVLGGPGAGKSTYLRRIGLEALKFRRSRFQHECIPVMLELKRFNDEQVDIKAAIVEEFSHVGFDFSAGFVDTALQQGKLLVLLDGLDEVPKANQDRVCQAIQDFVSRYSQKTQGNRFIASCRIAAFRSGLTGFTDIQLADFDNEQIRQFIENWFHKELDRTTNTAEKCWNLLNNASFASAKDLAQTPLLLTFLCVVYDHTQSFPANRAVLYRKALNILLEEWAAEKRIRHEPIYEGLNTELEKVLLADIAYKGFTEDRVFFTGEELIGHIQKFLEDSAEKPKYLDGKAVLTAIAVQQGILVERAENIYSFSHLTVQEYLTSQYLSQNQTALVEVVSQYLTEQRWREEFLLVPGLLPNSDDLLKQMAEIAQQRVCTPKLQALLVWSDQVTFTSNNPVPSPANRVLAIFFALELNLDGVLTSSLDLHLANILIDGGIDFNLMIAHLILLSHDLDEILKRVLDHILFLPDIFNGSVNLPILGQKLEALKTQLLDKSKPIRSRRVFANRLLKVWCNQLGIDRKLLNLSKTDVQGLFDHLYICELMIRCKESAVRVSREVWESIEDAMVMPTLDTEL